MCLLPGVGLHLGGVLVCDWFCSAPPSARVCICCPEGFAALPVPAARLELCVRLPEPLDFYTHITEAFTKSITS